MVKQRAIVTTVVLAILAITIGVALTSYAGHSVASRDNDAVLLWGPQEGYLFIKASRLGWRRGPLTLLWDFTRAALGIGLSGPVPTSAVRDVVVIRITPAGVERFELADTALGFVGILDGQIYTTQDGKILRWVGRRFESPAANESIDLSKMARMNFADRDGWSGKSNILSQPHGATQHMITLAGEQWTITAHNDLDSSQSKAVEVGKAGEKAQRVWFQDQRMKYVNATEFDAFLSNRGVVQ